MKRIPLVLAAALILTTAATAHAYLLISDSLDQLIRSADTILEVDFDPAFKSFTVLETVVSLPAAKPIAKGTVLSVDLWCDKDGPYSMRTKRHTPTSALLFLKDGKVLTSGVRVLTIENFLLMPVQSTGGPYTLSASTGVPADTLKSTCIRLKTIATEVDQIVAITDSEKQRAAALQWIDSHRKTMADSPLETAEYGEYIFGTGVLDPRPFQILVTSKDLPTAWQGVQLFTQLTAVIPAAYRIPGIDKAPALASAEGHALLLRTAHDSSAVGLDRAIALSLICTPRWNQDFRDIPPTAAETQDRLAALADLIAHRDAATRRAAAHILTALRPARDTIPADLITAIAAAYQTEAKFPTPDRNLIADALFSASPKTYAEATHNPLNVFGTITLDPFPPASTYLVNTCCREKTRFKTQPTLHITPTTPDLTPPIDQKSRGTMIIQADGFLPPNCKLPFDLPQLPPGKYTLVATATIRNQDATESSWQSEPLQITLTIPDKDK